MTATVRLAPGDGWLARRDDGLLFVSADWPQALDVFITAESSADGREAVTDSAASSGFDVPSFVIVTWAGAVECVVFGAIEVQTDDPRAPMLTGSGLGTWIERRLRVGDDPLGIRCGRPAIDSSRLTGGVVPAGGFELTVVVSAEASPPAAADAEMTMTAADFEAARDATESEGEQITASDAPAAGRTSDFEAIAAAAGDDWMEESLGLRSPRGEQIAAQAESARSTGQVVDDESTWIPSDQDDDQGEEVGRPAAADSATPRVDPPGPPLPPSPSTDPDWMTRPPDLTDQIPLPQALVQARRCPRGHLNPPQIEHCRVCAETIDPTADVETTRQPLLANAVLADSTVIPIDGTVVLGRNPDRDAARVGDDARVVMLAASTAVSRTHVALRADEWSLTATDCGSRGGVVVVTPGREPVMLEPWIPQEISVGDTIYLGGPTSVRIDPAE